MIKCSFVCVMWQDFSGDSVVISYDKNGEDLGTCFTIEASELADQPLFPHILTKNCSFECNFGQMVRPFCIYEPQRDDRLRLIGKRVVDFLLVLIELFFARCYVWGATSEYRFSDGVIISFILGLRSWSFKLGKTTMFRVMCIFVWRCKSRMVCVCAASAGDTVLSSEGRIRFCEWRAGGGESAWWSASNEERRLRGL